MLKKKQKMALELFLEGELNQKEIAQQIGVTEQTIVNWKKNEEFITEFNDAIKGKLHTAAGKALKRELELLKRADSDSVSLNAAKDILDRAGFKADSLVKLDGKLDVNQYDDSIKQLEEYFADKAGNT